MSIKLWLCKRLTKRIEKREQQILKFQIAINTLNKWIKQDKKKLNERLKQLTDEENLGYGLQCGFVDKTDYQMMKTGMDMIVPPFKTEVNIRELSKKNQKLKRK